MSAPVAFAIDSKFNNRVYYQQLKTPQLRKKPFPPPLLSFSVPNQPIYKHYCILQCQVGPVYGLHLISS